MSPDPQERKADNGIISAETFIARLLAVFDILKDQMEGLRDIINTTIPYASTLDESDARLAQLRKIYPKIPKEELRGVADLLRQAADSKMRPGEMMHALLEKYESQDWSYELVLTLDKLFTRQPRLPMLRNSLLIAAVAAFEAAVGNVATQFFHYKPEALEMNSRDREKEFSLKDLKQFGTISDAVEFSISKRVESLMFGGISDWRRFFRDAFKVDMEELVIDWPELQEILQRRHVIVHNGGRASRRYVSQVKQIHPKAKVTEGQLLDCNQDYLEHAIDHLLVAGVLLINAVGAKFSGARILSNELSNLALSLLQEDRMVAAKHICDFGVSLPIGQNNILVFRVNRALAIKAMHGMGDITDDIRKWDVSALSDRFKLAKASLLGDMDEAFDLLARLVDQDEIGVEELLEWPLFSDMRKDHRFLTLLMPRLNESSLEMLNVAFVVLNERTGTIHKPTCRLAKSGTHVHIESPKAQAARRCKVCWR